MQRARQRREIGRIADDAMAAFSSLSFRALQHALVKIAEPIKVMPKPENEANRVKRPVRRGKNIHTM